MTNDLKNEIIENGQQKELAQIEKLSKQLIDWKDMERQIAESDDLNTIITMYNQVNIFSQFAERIKGKPKCL